MLNLRASGRNPEGLKIVDSVDQVQTRHHKTCILIFDLRCLVRKMFPYLGDLYISKAFADKIKPLQIASSSLQGTKILSEKQKMLETSIFSISDNVLNGSLQLLIVWQKVHLHLLTLLRNRNFAPGRS